MKILSKLLMAVVLVGILLLTACGEKVEKSGDEQGETNIRADSAIVLAPDKGNLDEEDSNVKVESASSLDEEDSNVKIESASSLKEGYLAKLAELKSEFEDARANPEDYTTYAMKKVEGDIFDTIDPLLNEIYGVLKEQLSVVEMEQLRAEQREWITYRDNTAKAESEQYKGGTMEPLVYTAVLNDLTVARCEELVEQYME